jgi:hypothetical protein
MPVCIRLFYCGVSMQGYKKGHDYGPSWGEFCEALTNYCEASGRMACVEVARTAPAFGACRLYFRVVSFTRWERGVKVAERAEGHQWPANEWATVPAMLWALLHRLEAREEELRLQAEAQAAF